MAKARTCPHCGVWYKPKFGGDAEQCYGCIIRKKIADDKEAEKSNSLKRE